MSRRIEDLDPRCQDAARKTLDALTADDELRNSGVAGWLIVETRRELATQMAYFARGRMAPEHVRMMYDAAGLKQKLTDKETQTAITTTLKSKHLSGLAMDIVPIKADGKAWWDAPTRVWMRMATIAEGFGWESGVRWKDFPDYPHLQWRGA